jgi:hypothetical protein
MHFVFRSRLYWLDGLLELEFVSLCTLLELDGSPTPATGGSALTSALLFGSVGSKAIVFCPDQCSAKYELRR